MSDDLPDFSEINRKVHLAVEGCHETWCGAPYEIVEIDGARQVINVTTGREYMTCSVCAQAYSNGERVQKKPAEVNDQQLDESDPLMGAKKDLSIEEATDWLRRKLEKGAHCPCCTQFAKVYERTINVAMAKALIVVFSKHTNDWFHAPTLFSSLGGDFAKMARWGLIEEHTEKPVRGGKTAGMWRLTDLGRAFAADEVTVTRTVRIYDDRTLGFTGPQISIKDALGGKRFDYDTMMDGKE